MRVLLLLRGSAGVGKSYWIEQNGLKQYALSADEIRMMSSSPIMTADGKMAISQANDKTVWKILFELLETRMKNGEFTVIDATNSKTSEMNRYKKLCDEYKYRMYCVDFTDVPIEVTKERNLQRAEVKQVPEYVIDKMYSRFATQKIPSGITVIRPDELECVWIKPMDLSGYKKIHHIGDIHGCYTALNEYFDKVGGIKDDEFYIFCGDYIDRGLENADVIQFLLSIYNKPNVMLLEGNHERWLWIWANNGVGKSKEFELVTKTQLNQANISKKDVRQLYRKMAQCAHYKYKNNYFIVTHAGLSKVPEKMTTVSTEQMLKGVGNYNDFEVIANTFAEKAPENYYQIHGHRNTKNLPVRINDKVFNLEGGVEFGRHLRCVQVSEDTKFDIVEIKNDVFKLPEVKNEGEILETNKSVGDLIIELRRNRYVAEKEYGNISSFNFTKSAFYDKIWDEQTMRARGLYINIPKQKIVARSYNKFFNINERPETKFDMLQHKLSFPVTTYVKENGFLGIVSYNEETEDLFITTKSSPEGAFALWLKDIIYRKIDKNTLEKIKNYAKDNNVSFVFECVDTKRDPHVIEYPEDSLYLLDIINNNIEFEKYNYDKLVEISNDFGLVCKEKAYVLHNWQEFYDWYFEVMDEDYKYNERNIEGFVIEDANGYMVKLKLQYYHFWKYMRSIAHEAIRKGYIDPKRTSSLLTPLANEFYAWVRTLHDKNGVDIVPKDICTLRALFYKSKKEA